MINIYFQNKHFKAHIKYVFSIIEQVIGYKFNYLESINEFKRGILILYRDNDELNCFIEERENIIVIDNSKLLFGKQYLKKQSIPNSVRRVSLEERITDIAEIISIYHQTDKLYFSYKNKKVITNVDIIANIFFMLTRYEELVNNAVMKGEIYERFPAAEALAFKYNFLDKPIVNEYIELLKFYIEKMGVELDKNNLWDDKEFAVCITHDIDCIQKHKNFKHALKYSAILALKYKNYKSAINEMATYVKSKINYRLDNYWTFDYMINVEEKNNFKSSFYFMSGGNSNYDNKYKFEDKRVKDLIKTLEDKQFEVGHHSSFNSYNNYDLMKSEREKLDNSLSNHSYGVRQHFLRFNIPETWRIQQDLGYLYDTTLGYAASEGFRAGICHPFRPFDAVNGQVLNIWELPLIVMETSLLDKNYKNYSADVGINKVINLIEIVKRYGGVFTMLWHNSSIGYSTKKLEEWTHAYDYIMDYLGRCQCFASSGRDVIIKYEEKVKNFM